MKETRLLMGMPITVEITDPSATVEDVAAIFSYFTYVDEKFSTYKETSEISQINRGLLSEAEYSDDMKLVFSLSNETKRLTDGYFNIQNSEGIYDPSGLVKGWAIHNAAKILQERGRQNFYVDAGGDIQAQGTNGEGKSWSVGIRNPFNKEEIVKNIIIRDQGVATSGTYIRGQHIYNPYRQSEPITDIVSLTVIGPNVYEADRFATAAFAMGKRGIQFIEALPGFEGYQIDAHGNATMTKGFEAYTNAYAEIH